MHGQLRLHGRRGHDYVGYAAHCAGTGEATDTNGCDAGSLPLGTRVHVRRGRQPGQCGHHRRRRDARVLVLADHAAARARRNPNTCAYNDLALVKVDAADVAQGEPVVPFWGGPVGIDTDGTAAGDQRLLLRQLQPPRRGRRALTQPGVSLGDDAARRLDPPASTPSTPGVPGDSGAASSMPTGNAVGTLSTLAIAPLPARTTSATSPTSSPTRRSTRGIAGLQLVNGTEPFTPCDVSTKRDRRRDRLGGLPAGSLRVMSARPHRDTSVAGVGAGAVLAATALVARAGHLGGRHRAGPRVRRRPRTARDLQRRSRATRDVARPIPARSDEEDEDAGLARITAVLVARDRAAGGARLPRWCWLLRWLRVRGAPRSAPTPAPTPGRVRGAPGHRRSWPPRRWSATPTSSWGCCVEGSPRNGIVACWHRFEVQAEAVGHRPAAVGDVGGVRAPGARPGRGRRARGARAVGAVPRGAVLRPRRSPRPHRATALTR